MFKWLWVEGGKADRKIEATKSDFSPSESKYFLTPKSFWCNCWKFLLLCSTTWSEILTPVKEEPLELRFGENLIHLRWLYLYFLCEYTVTFSVAFLFRNLKSHLVVEDGYLFLSCVTQISSVWFGLLAWTRPQEHITSLFSVFWV